MTTTHKSPDAGGCTEACRTSVNCAVCGKRKNPHGRSAPIEMASGLCDWECIGYNEAPQAPHLWPNEPLPGESTDDE